MSSFFINDEKYYDQYTINFLTQDTDLTYTNYLYLYNNKVDSVLKLTLPTNYLYIGISLFFNNPNLNYSILSTTSNIKQIDGTISNLICSVDNFSNLIFDGTNWLVTMTN